MTEVPTLKEFKALEERVKQLEEYIKRMEDTANECLTWFKPKSF